MLSSCCKAVCTTDAGYRICTNCGRLVQHALDTCNTSYNHTSSIMFKPYSRRSRFEKKVLGMLRCLVNYAIDEKLLFFLKHRKIKTPEDLHQEIGLYPTKGRRPFDSIVYYWRALGHPQPTCTDRDILFLKQDFAQVFFAWDRLGFQNPRFPYSYLFRKIVLTNATRYSKSMAQMTRFVRVLRCQMRRARYNDRFKRCIAFDYQNMDDDTKQDKPKPSSAGQTHTVEKID